MLWSKYRRQILAGSNGLGSFRQFLSSVFFIPSAWSAQSSTKKLEYSTRAWRCNKTRAAQCFHKHIMVLSSCAWRVVAITPCCPNKKQNVKDKKGSEPQAFKIDQHYFPREMERRGSVWIECASDPHWQKRQKHW